MTEDEHELLRETHNLAKENHDYWFKPPVTGKKTRAQEMDDAVTFVNNSKVTVRVIIWIPGFFITLAGAWALLKGYFTK